ncbi:bile acid:sodium symporter family protein [Ectobacillus ponti]|uniref:Bile acid:sodium symporter family protein n=1 Tax=Ectobacillus ponti TaxID=2961894 RepID=A0AA41X4K8_9BACI|nr:bile acid:sodium symporter family protein [Ectobacillus ponti]MCP8968617.1 bile acid:sodium symporter family protein [Ectobacillus ponti]
MYVNRMLERLMPVMTPASVLIGVMAAAHLKGYAYLVPWIFAFMTFAGSLSSSFGALGRSLSRPLPLMAALFILHVAMPLWAWGVGHVAFAGDAYTITGLVLAVVIPTGITSFIWVSIYKGNLGFTLSLILIDTFLSPFLVPYSISLLAGEKVAMDTWGIMKGLLIMVVVPSVLGMLLHEVTKGKVKQTLAPKLAPISKLGLATVVMINSSVVAPYLEKVDGKLLFTAAIVFVVAASGYALSWGVGMLFKWERADVAALLFTGGMRNISAGAVVAVHYFPAAVAVPVVIGMLFQQVLASLYGRLLHEADKRKAASAAA